jgi:hypothetical protein
MAGHRPIRQPYSYSVPSPLIDCYKIPVPTVPQSCHWHLSRSKKAACHYDIKHVLSPPHVSPAAHFNRIFVIRILSGKSGSMEQLDVLSGSRGADLFYDKLLEKSSKARHYPDPQIVFSRYLTSDIWCSDYGGRIQIRREHSFGNLGPAIGVRL